MGNQALALRKRWLISSFEGGRGPGDKPGLTGTYWDTGLYRSYYPNGDTLGYSKDIAKLIAHIRTDLDTFSDGEARILENPNCIRRHQNSAFRIPTGCPKTALRRPLRTALNAATTRASRNARGYVAG
jgi:hypothetical protein